MASDWSSVIMCLLYCLLIGQYSLTQVVHTSPTIGSNVEEVGVVS